MIYNNINYCSKMFCVKFVLILPLNKVIVPLKCNFSNILPCIIGTVIFFSGGRFATLTLFRIRVALVYLLWLVTTCASVLDSF